MHAPRFRVCWSDWRNPSRYRILRMWCQSRRKGLMFLVTERSKAVAFITLSYTNSISRHWQKPPGKPNKHMRAYVLLLSTKLGFLLRWACFASRGLSVDDENARSMKGRRFNGALTNADMFHYSRKCHQQSWNMITILYLKAEQLNFIPFLMVNYTIFLYPIICWQVYIYKIWDEFKYL